MKKQIIVIVVFMSFFSNFSIYSQIKLGLSAGINESELSPVTNGRDGQIEIISTFKPGFYAEADISKEIKKWFLIEAGLFYNDINPSARITSWPLGGYYVKDGKYKINSYCLSISPALGFKKVGLYFIPGIYMGYANCKFSGTGQGMASSISYPGNDIHESNFNVFDYGAKIDIRLTKHLMKVIDIYINIGYKESFADFTKDKVSYDGYQLRLGLSKTL